jgi:hypothetical protein
MSRTIILHYHLFKNAGTSLDRILKRNFQDRWVTAEFPMKGDDNSALVADWIRANPDAVAFSSHTAIGPVPQIDGVNIVSVLMLRDPVARIRSAYRFERKQEAATWGAQLAKEHDLEGYVRTRLARANDRQCRNFQTHRLAALIPGDGPELDRARTGLQALSLVGLVEDFDGTMTRLDALIRSDFPDFTWDSVQANTSSAEPGTEGTGTDLETLLTQENADDLAVWQDARAMAGLT